MPIEVRPAEDRYVTLAEGRTTFHSFSFGPHYDPRNLGFGSLIAHNDERLPPGTGYADHPHSDLEIVTFVVSGALQHRSSVGSGIVEAGQVQHLSAGSGVVHEEIPIGATRFIQAWVRPDEPGLAPRYSAVPVEPTRNELICVVDDLKTASLHLGQLDAGASLQLPDAPLLHVFVASGSITIGDRLLIDGDAGRLRGQGGRSVSSAAPGSVVLVWTCAG